MSKTGYNWKRHFVAIIFHRLKIPLANTLAKSRVFSFVCGAAFVLGWALLPAGI